MYSVAVKDHIMIAHSFRGDVFGPAQALHGATFVITTEYRATELDEDGIVIDIGKAIDVLAEVLKPLRYQNLDDLEGFEGKNTTTEFLAKHVHDQVSARVQSYFEGDLKVVLEESHVAWGSYEAPISIR
ncbi:MAG: 6-pyruvoyltetrahydropterin/6-carboxytetrahydropterin synthase [Planctomycetota bacterium]|jgi:6-pyruvoyltetrahydropterin/6-carboxytetrahydropterin synthase